MPRRRQMQLLPSGTLACSEERCYKASVGWARLRPWCAEHMRDETPAVNCACQHPGSKAGYTLKVDGKTMCSWCGGTL